MDLLEFNEHNLYFDRPLPEGTETLLEQASEAGMDAAAELPLLRAFVQAPTHLTVLVALYRYYYYSHRLQEALHVARQARVVAGAEMGFPDDWRDMDLLYLSAGARRSLGQVRFYLLSLKAEGFLYLRLAQYAAGRERLQKVRELDEADRLGAAALLAIIDSCGDYQSTAPKQAAHYQEAL